MIGKVGFMQGRLSEVVDGKIQAFPWKFWQEEFKVAGKINIPLMEWTLDQYDLYANPLMTVDGQRKILQLSDKYDYVLSIEEDNEKIKQRISFPKISNIGRCSKDVNKYMLTTYLNL